jgi:FAD dependent oxidoreductase
LLDSGNIAILPNGRLSWNALLWRVTAAEAEQLARNAAKPTPAMLEEIKFIDQWFRSIGATAVKPMTELYIRHAGNVTGVVEPLSGTRMLEGGVDAVEAIGTFGYALDVRGGIAGLGTKAVSKGAGSINFEHPPLFNIGIRHALLRSVPNLAVVSPASGFDGYACAAGRIVEFNVAVGQGLGIAATLAIVRNRNLADINNMDVRQVLVKTTQLPRIYGKSYLTEASRLQAFEQVMIA